MRIGVIPAIGAGLQTMHATGQLERLWAHLDAYGQEVTFFSYLSPDAEWPLWRQFCGTNSIGRRLPTNIRGWSPKRLALLWPLVSPVAFRSCDVLRGLNLQAAVPCLMARIIHGIPFVVSHGADYEAIARIHGHDGQARKWRWLRRLAFRFAAAVIVPNPVQAERLQRQFPRARIVHLPNWVDTERFHPTKAGPPGPRRVLLYVGRLVAEKNLARLARVADQIGVPLYVIGAGPEEVELQRLGAKCLGTIPWVVLPRYLAMAESGCFVLPSISEGHPKALLEAMATGLQCAVSSRVEGVVEHMKDAVVFDPENEGEMAAAILLCLNDGPLTRSMRRVARAKAEALWAKDKVLPREVALLREVAKKR